MMVALGVVPKRNIPGYGEFYETRNFSPGPGEVRDCLIGGRWVPFGGNMVFRCRQLPAFCLGVEICEDLWVLDPPSGRLAAASPGTGLPALSRPGGRRGPGGYPG